MLLVERSELARNEDIVPLVAQKLMPLSVLIVRNDIGAAGKIYLDPDVPSSHDVVRAEGG